MLSTRLLMKIMKEVLYNTFCFFCVFFFFLIKISLIALIVITHRPDGEYLYIYISFVSLQEVDLIMGSLVPGKSGMNMIHMLSELPRTLAVSPLTICISCSNMTSVYYSFSEL